MALIVTPQEASRDEFNKLWDDLIGPAINRALDPIRKENVTAPARLLHLTTVAGFEAILRTRILRISRARSSNDPMELDHGLGLAEKVLEQANPPYHPIFVGILKASMRAPEFLGREHRVPDPYVCCFSERESESDIPLWAMYGQGGSGFALVFDGPAIAKKGLCDFVRVLYSEQEQAARLQRVIAQASETCAAVKQRLSGMSDAFERDRMYAYAIHSWGNIIAMHAATMKRAQFQFEKEWRVMVGQMLKVTVPEQLNFGVATHGALLRGYYELPFDRADLKEVIVGANQYEMNEPVVKAFLEHEGYESVEVSRGSVALRGPTAGG